MIAELTSSPMRARLRVALYFVDLAAAAAGLDAAEQITPRLAPDEEARCAAIAVRDRSEADRWRRAHIALRIALERHAGAVVRCAPYAVAPGGRPQLSNMESAEHAPYFSLSHSGGYALIAISHAGPIGVDLETGRALSVSAERRSRIEAAAARLALDAPLASSPDDRFMQAWVRLEAVAKATGLGIGRILTEAGVVGGGTDARVVGAASEGAPVRDLSLAGGCFAAVSAAQLPQILLVEDFLVEFADLVQFAAASKAQ